ncbi:uncharacterized protein LOC111029524, partial [Myzus persicae]|uniref:uncharacterized protein LOC111029524 n=1 Tax=Myzus persicae TaxID=13164 RepID=UPI000B93894A
LECGKVNKKSEVTSKDKKATIETAPWNVLIYKLFKTDSNYYFSCVGSLIGPNVVISIAHGFWKNADSPKTISVNDGSIKVAIGKYDKNFKLRDNLTQIVDVETIYVPEGYNSADGNYAEDISVLVLSHKVSFINGVAPVCIDWSSKYEVQNGAQGKILVWEDTKNDTQSLVLLEKLFPYIDHSTCQRKNTSGLDEYLTYDKICAGSKLGNTELAYRVGSGDSGSGISFLHSNSYFLTGVLSTTHTEENNTVAGFTGIKHHIKFIQGILNKRVIVNSCVLPTAEGVLYSYEGSNETLPHGALIDHHLIVIENCAVGYYKAYPNGFRFCQGRGKWLSNSEKLCFKMCPPLLSDSLDIKCTLNGQYANCSNLSIPNTIATPSCKPTYSAPYGQEDTPLELHCQSNASGFHAEDIAIIVLRHRVSFSNGVAPICIDWNSKYNVVNGDQGKIVGWGKTEKGIPSPILLEAYLPYIDHSSCRNMYTNGFEPFVTVDKFCAGSESVSGQGVGRGDSGAGLCFFHSELYYLTGVASIKDPNTNNSIAVFTDVKYHIQWIRGLYNKYNYIQ